MNYRNINNSFDFTEINPGGESSTKVFDDYAPPTANEAPPSQTQVGGTAYDEDLKKIARKIVTDPKAKSEERRSANLISALIHGKAHHGFNNHSINSDEVMNQYGGQLILNGLGKMSDYLDRDEGLQKSPVYNPDGSKLLGGGPMAPDTQTTITSQHPLHTRRGFTKTSFTA